MDAEHEKGLVKACQYGDAEAYAELLKHHSRCVFAVCLGMLGNAADAEDCAQAAFMKGFEGIARLRRKDWFGWWIVRIARNECIDYLRRKKLEKKVLEALVAGRREADAAPGGDLESAVMRLPEQFRVPLLLFYFDGRSAESVARTLDVSTGAMHVRLCRARRELRKILECKEADNERSVREDA